MCRNFTASGRTRRNQRFVSSVSIPKFSPKTLSAITSNVKQFDASEKSIAGDQPPSDPAAELPLLPQPPSISQNKRAFLRMRSSMPLTAVVVKACAMMRLFRACSAGSSMDTRFMVPK